MKEIKPKEVIPESMEYRLEAHIYFIENRVFDDDLNIIKTPKITQPHYQKFNKWGKK